MKVNAEEVCQVNNITDDDLKSICKRYLVKEGYDFRKFWINTIEFEKFSNKAFGFLGYHLKLTVTVSPKNVSFFDEPESEAEDDADERKLTFFAKLLPRANQSQADYVEQMGIFEKETDLYQLLIPRLQDLAIGAKEWAAQSYLSKDEKVLILEDLRLDGFQVPLQCRQGLFDLEHLLVAAAVLARFHASSMILEHRSRESLLKLYPNLLNETAYPEDEHCVRMRGLKNAITALEALVQHMDKYRGDERALELIQRQLSGVVQQIVQFAKPSTRFRNCFTHGDLWANNFLFQYVAQDTDSSDDESNTEEEQEQEGAMQIQVEINQESTEDAEVECVLRCLDEQIKEARRVVVVEPRRRRTMKPVDGRLVDFQLARYAPPAMDLMTLLHMTSTRAFRAQHSRQVLEQYYESLTVELDRLGLDVGYELPQEQFWASVQHYAVAGMVEACLFSHLTLLPEEQTERMFSDSVAFGEYMEDGQKRAAVCARVFQEDRAYRLRMTELLEELIETTIVEVTAL